MCVMEKKGISETKTDKKNWVHELSSFSIEKGKPKLIKIVEWFGWSGNFFFAAQFMNKLTINKFR